MEMIEIPGGEFRMGSPEEGTDGYRDEMPQHIVTIQPFKMGKYPVTQGWWQEVMGNNPSYFRGEDRPVENVTWMSAIKFCERLSEAMGRHYKLPSEAKWEYACRAGTTTSFALGETITSDIVNYHGEFLHKIKGKHRGETVSAGSLGVANAFGLYDMHGNVWEWCGDVWHSNYKGAPTDGSSWVEEGETKSRVIRGGSWLSSEADCRSAFRCKLRKYDRSNDCGLRVMSD